MRSSWKVACQAVALFLTFVLMQVYVMATPPATDSTTGEAASNAQPSTMLFGRLSAFGAEKVVVNGNQVTTGTTILSGAQLQTPNGTAATVTLASAGKLDIAPNSNVVVTFDSASASVNVISGDAMLTTNEGVKGSLTAADGKTELADGRSATSIGTAMYAGDETGAQGSNQNPNPNNRRCRIAGMPCALFWAMVGGGGAVALFFAFHRSNNPSPAR